MNGWMWNGMRWEREKERTKKIYENNRNVSRRGERCWRARIQSEKWRLQKRCSLWIWFSRKLISIIGCPFHLRFRLFFRGGSSYISTRYRMDSMRTVRLASCSPRIRFMHINLLHISGNQFDSIMRTLIPARKRCAQSVNDSSCGSANGKWQINSSPHTYTFCRVVVRVPKTFPCANNNTWK